MSGIYTTRERLSNYLKKFRSTKDSENNLYVLYDLWDRFDTALAAGSVNGTLAEPVGGARTVTDTTNSKISIAGGVLDFATGATSADGIWYPAITRALGKSYLLRIINPNINACYIGFDSNTSTYTSVTAFNINTTTIKVYPNDTSQIIVGVGVISVSETYELCTVLRASGAFYLIKGGVFTNWTLLWADSRGTTASLYPAINVNIASIFTADNVRVPKRLFVPVPLQSDGFSAATTDGAGNAEANGAVGNAYTNVGTWGVASGVRSCSVLSGGLGFSYLACSSSNVILDAAVTRGAGVAGLVARYVDAQNYLIAYHDGTNAKLDKVVAGVTTSLISAAKAYSAGAVLRLILDGTKARLFYDNATVGALATTPAAGSLNHGLYTTDILSNGNSFDDLVVMARGNEGQYSGLDSL